MLFRSYDEQPSQKRTKFVNFLLPAFFRKSNCLIEFGLIMVSGMKALSIWLGLLFCAASAVVSGAPANNNFLSATLLTGSSAFRIDSNVGATGEFGEPYHDGNQPAASIWYRWTAPADGLVTISAAGSSFDTVLALYRGTSLTSLVAIKSNDDAGNLYTSEVRAIVYAGTSYRIAVDGFLGDMGTVDISLNLRSDLPRPTIPTRLPTSVW